MRDKAWAHSGEVNQNSFSPLLTGLNMLPSLFHLNPSVLWLCLASPWLEDLRDLQASVTHQGLAAAMECYAGFSGSFPH